MRPSTSLSRFVLRFVVGTIAVALSFGLSMPVAAQSRVVTTPVAILSTPNGKSIGSVHPGVTVRLIETRGAYAKVSLDGFVERSRISAQRGSTSPRIGNRAAVVRSKGAASARSVASLNAGTSVAVSGANAPSGWVKVTRDVWILKASLERSTASDAGRKLPDSRRAVATTKGKSKAADRKASGGEVASPTSTAPNVVPTRPATPPTATSSRPPVAPSTSAVAALSDSSLVPTTNIALRTAPDARPLATVAKGTTLVPLAHDRGWVRVRLEGWVPEKDLAPADTTVRTGVSAADLRADPQGSKGKVVRWSVQLLAKQKADALRRDLAPDETYLLARGPYEENALLYLVVPPSLMPMAKSIPELTQVMITARVRTGRSDLVGVPILDLLTMTPRK
jgi:hypothetical protein